MLAIFALVGNGIAAECTSLQELGKILVGKILFFDSNLSEPPGQSCAACHGPDVGFTGPDEDINIGQVVYPGAVSSLAGNRKPPSSAYGGDSPILDFDELSGLWIGGMFWDGRATGWTLKDPLAEQAQGPFLNELEQNLPSAAEVVRRVRKSWYAFLFKFVWGRTLSTRMTSLAPMSESLDPLPPTSDRPKSIHSTPSMTITSRER